MNDMYTRSSLYNQRDKDNCITLRVAPAAESCFHKRLALELVCLQLKLLRSHKTLMFVAG